MIPEGNPSAFALPLRTRSDREVSQVPLHDCRGSYGQLSNFQPGKIGPAPGKSEPLKGMFRRGWGPRVAVVLLALGPV